MVKFNPEISLGSIITILGGIITLSVTAVTLYVQFQSVKVEQEKIIVKTDTMVTKQQHISETVARMEGKLEALTSDRRRASLRDD